jgi:site-specific DNA-methyltransferase (cytosine-N4-specific)
MGSCEQNRRKAANRDLYDAVALKLAVSEEHRNEEIVLGGQRVNTFERTVRWSQQLAKARGLIAPTGKSSWELTGKGKDALHTAAPGIVRPLREYPWVTSLI